MGGGADEDVVEDVDALLALLARGAELDDEETLDVLAHSLQCAALLADRVPDDPELAVAGLVHDVGTVVEPDRPATHAATGARVVARLLGSRVARLVAWHAEAKRYLVATDPAYAARLSGRSRVTLVAQGGPLDAEARRALARRPDWPEAVLLRRADDDAKDPHRSVPDLEHWRPVLGAVAVRARADGP